MEGVEVWTAEGNEMELFAADTARAAASEGHFLIEGMSPSTVGQFSKTVLCITVHTIRASMVAKGPPQ